MIPGNVVVVIAALAIAGYLGMHVAIVSRTPAASAVSTRSFLRLLTVLSIVGTLVFWYSYFESPGIAPAPEHADSLLGTLAWWVPFFITTMVATFSVTLLWRSATTFAKMFWLVFLLACLEATLTTSEFVPASLRPFGLYAAIASTVFAAVFSGFFLVHLRNGASIFTDFAKARPNQALHPTPGSHPD